MAVRRSKGDGSIFQRPDGRWVGQVNVSAPGAKRRRKTIYGATKAEVRRKLADAKDQISHGNHTTSSMTFGAWLDYWLENVVQVRPGTLNNYRRIVRLYIQPELGGVRLDHLNLDHPVRLRKSMDHLSTSTKMQAHRTAGNALQAAMIHGLTVRNPFKVVKAVKAKRQKRRSFNQGELDDFIKAIEKRPDSSRWLTAVILGARQGECLGLTWDRVDFDNMTFDFAWQAQRIPYRHGCTTKTPCGYKRAYRCYARQIDADDSFDFHPIESNICWVPPKTDAARRIAPIPLALVGPLRRRYVEYLEQRLSPDYHDHGLVWARGNGSPLDDREDYRTWKQILADADIDHLALHGARNSAATKLLRDGTSPIVSQAIMGHSDAAMTEHYQTADISLARLALDQGYEDNPDEP